MDNKFIQDGATIPDVICNSCTNYLGRGKCKAFDSIPDGIIFGDIPHDTIIDGQKGNFVYKPSTSK